MSRDSNPFTVSIVQVVPTWLQGVTIGQWVQIPNTTMSNVFPGTLAQGVATIAAWNGGAMDERNSTYYIAADGGDGDSSWNGVIGLTLSANLPGWSVKFAGSTAGAVLFDTPYYSDGRPASRHTYYQKQYCPERDRVMLFGAGSLAHPSGAGGPTSGKVDGFNTLGNTWDPAATYPDIPGGPPSYSSWTTARNPANGDVYLVCGISGTRAGRLWNQAANTWTNLALPPGNTYGYEMASIFDSTRGQYVVLDQDSSQASKYSVSSGTWSTSSCSGLTAQMGAVYIAAIDRILTRTAAAGGVVTQIDPATYASSSFATTGGGSIPSRPTACYSSFIYAPALKGCFYMPRWDANCWFLRVY